MSELWGRFSCPPSPRSSVSLAPRRSALLRGDGVRAVGETNLGQSVEGPVMPAANGLCPRQIGFRAPAAD